MVIFPLIPCILFSSCSCCFDKRTYIARYAWNPLQDFWNLNYNRMGVYSEWSMVINNFSQFTFGHYDYGCIYWHERRFDMDIFNSYFGSYFWWERYYLYLCYAYYTRCILTSRSILDPNLNYNFFKSRIIWRLKVYKIFL